MKHRSQSGAGAILRTDNLEESLAKLAFLIERASPLGVLVGSAGMGKSACLRMLADEVRAPDRRVVEISVAGMCAETLLSAIAAGLGLGRTTRLPVDRLTLLLDYFEGISITRESVALLLDDVELAGNDSLRLIESLVRRVRQANLRVTIIAAAQTPSSGAMRDLSGLADFVVKLATWTQRETARYAMGVIEQINQRSGASRCVIDDSGLRALQDCSEGVPGRLARILELALLACEEMELPRLNEEIIRAASDELFPQDAIPIPRRTLQPVGV